MPRKEGMERKDLLKANVAIFKSQGAALDKYAKKTVKTVQQRGAAVIKARKLSSAMSAAKAICDHMRDIWFGTPEGEFTSLGIYSTGNSYAVPEDLIYSFPVQIKVAII
ncbi:hypothetical protein XENOCAPTIV_011118 [Xenoophorus captivus]|uniref:Lactate/malate dehydrogenase C-terminal domain-containing protein n=1 Tax=Xenoophorus captivus TaxID=1517983 RepID=A0ABV0S2B2_9TELE